MTDWDKPFPMRYKDQPEEMVTLNTLIQWIKKKDEEEKLRLAEEQQKSSVPPEKPQSKNE